MGKIRTNVMGLDISLVSTGYFCIACDEYSNFNYEYLNRNILASGVVKLKKTGNDIKDFSEGASRIADICLFNSCSIVSIENYGYGTRGNISRIAEYTGVIKHELYTTGVIPERILRVAPPTLKKYATGAGNSDKGLVLKSIYKKYGIDIDDNNVADAFVLSLIGAEIWRYWVSPTYKANLNYERACVKSAASTSKVEILERIKTKKTRRVNRGN